VQSLFPVVAEFASRRAGLLSGGQQQQLAIARALLADPAVLLLDEPSLGLAPTIVDAVFAALQRVRERGVAILLVEQRAEVAISFADRTHVMRDGRVVLDVDPTAAADVPRLTAAYFGT
jgi:branched-chain amino acid transport system ATP-binding protein